MKKVCVIGHFGFDDNLLNGQTVKTKTVTSELERKFSKNEIIKIDTHGGIKRFPMIFFEVIINFVNSQNIIIYPAQNGLKIFAPMCVILKRLFNKKIHYVVIGGWLTTYLKDHKSVQKALRLFDAIYVETSTMKLNLERSGFSNIILLPNFKDLDILQKGDLIHEVDEPYRFCTFSRVMQEKGIEEAIGAVERINNEKGYIVCKLDIYGQIDEGQMLWFQNLKREFPKYISYKGVVPYDKSVETVKSYYAVLFPTKFYTEGIPGTILDAYAAGVPVVCSKWESYYDVVDDEETGWGYEFSDTEGLYNTLMRIVELKNEKYFEMKMACLNKAERYRPENGIVPLLKQLDERKME